MNTATIPVTPYDKDGNEMPLRGLEIEYELGPDYVFRKQPVIVYVDKIEGIDKEDIEYAVESFFVGKEIELNIN